MGDSMRIIRGMIMNKRNTIDKLLLTLAILILLLVGIRTRANATTPASTQTSETENSYKLEAATYYKLSTYLQQIQKSYGIPGMAVRVVNDKDVLFAENYGECQSGDDMFFIGSESKSYTAVCIMKLVEEGKVNLDEDITSYLPDRKFKEPVTVRGLLNQTSGLGTYQRLANAKVKEHYGTFQYANVNYDLLGEIIEKVSGMTYAEYLQQTVFDKLGMEHSSADFEVTKKGNVLNGNYNYFGVPVASKPAYPTEKSWFHQPAGYIAASPNDMAKYLQMYLNEGGKVLRPESVEQMFKSTCLTGELHSGEYGFGWFRGKFDGYDTYIHGGQVENYITYMYVIPDRNVAVSIMVNMNDEFVTNNLMEAVPLNVWKLLNNREIEPVKKHAYLARHVVLDLLYILAIIISILPFFYLRKSQFLKRRKYIFTIYLALIHVLLPCFILLCTRIFAGTPFWVVWSYAKDTAIVIIICAGSLFVSGLLQIKNWCTIWCTSFTI